MVLQHPDNYRCPRCRIIWRGSKEYAKHLRTHSFDLEVCHICGEGFMLKSRLEEHAICHRAEITGHQCHLCGIRCFYKSLLDQHLSQHDQPLGIVCNLCGEIFISPYIAHLHGACHQILSRTERRRVWNHRNWNN